MIVNKCRYSKNYNFLKKIQQTLRCFERRLNGFSVVDLSIDTKIKAMT